MVDDVNGIIIGGPAAAKKADVCPICQQEIGAAEEKIVLQGRENHRRCYEENRGSYKRGPGGKKFLFR